MEEKTVEAWIEVNPLGDDGRPGRCLGQADVDGTRLLADGGLAEVLREMASEWASTRGVPLAPGTYQVVAWWQYSGECAGVTRWEVP